MGEGEEEATIKNLVIVTSWDSYLRFFDDGVASDRVGKLIHDPKRHTD